MKILYSFLAVLMTQLIIFAQTDSLKSTLKEVVVSATKTETPYYSIASAVTVITTDELSSGRFNTLVEVLRTVPGMSIVEQGGPGKMSNVFMRGANTNHTLVLLDGVKLNDVSSTNNAYDFSSLNTNDIQRIEIVRGPQSTLYGSEAMAGVVNIITKSGFRENSYTLFAEGGSNNYFRGNLSISGSVGNLYYFASGSNATSEGFSASDSKYGNSERDGYKNKAATTKLGYNFTDNFKVDFLYKYTTLNSDLDQNEMLGDDPNYTYQLEEQIFRTGANLNLFDGIWNVSASASINKIIGHTLDLPDNIRPTTSSDSYSRGRITKFNIQNNLNFTANNLITLGLETETGEAYSSYISESMWGPYNSVFPQQSITTTGLYAQDQMNISGSMFITAGIRFDHNEKYGEATTFRIAPAYFIKSTSTKLKFTYGTGFKAPSLFNLYDPAYGNPDLNPEKSEGWDLGFEQFFGQGNISFGAEYFNLGFKNMFGYDDNFRTINIAEASSKGIELTLNAALSTKFNLNANYTFTETRDEYNLSTDFNKPLLRRPKHQLNLTASYFINNDLKVNAEIYYRGDRDDKDFSTYPVSRVVLGNYTLVNLSASYDLMNHVALTGRISNLFNSDYEEVLYYGTERRSIYLGVKLGY